MSTNNRASLLAGLRTGGVRSASGAAPQTAAPTVTTFPRQEMPMTAAIGGSFNQIYAQAQVQAQAQAFQMQMMQMEIMRLQAIQQAQQAQQIQLEIARQQNANRRASSYAMEPPQTAGPTATSFMTRRASQAEHLKAQLHLNNKPPIYEEQSQQQQQQFQQVPMTASLGGKFGGRLNPNATTFRMGAHFELEEEETTIRLPPPPPKTGSTAPANTPVTPNGYASTTVISGGTALGVAGGNSNGTGNGGGNGNGNVNANANANPGMTASKSDASLNWRRGAGSSTTVPTNTRAASLNVKITPPPPPPGERVSPPPGLSLGLGVGGIKSQHRPEPLRFSLVINEPPQTTVVVVDTSSDGEDGDGDADADADADDTSSSSAKSEPATPPSGGAGAVPPLSPREAASKRLYEGLGLGRPHVATVAAQSAAPHTLSFSTQAQAQAQAYNAPLPFTSTGMTFPNRGGNAHAHAHVGVGVGVGGAVANRVVSQPMRQPRGPPSNVDELGPKNFATRIRRKAIGGLGAMLDARVNRREVEAY